jgi:hypothetical protein
MKYVYNPFTKKERDDCVGGAMIAQRGDCGGA